MDEKAGIFEDDHGNHSYMRVMSFLSFLMSCIVAGLMFFRPPADSFTGLYIFSGFLVGGFVPKMIQKFAENLPNLKR